MRELKRILDSDVNLMISNIYIGACHIGDAHWDRKDSVLVVIDTLLYKDEEA
jgi:hypothetical protein